MPLIGAGNFTGILQSYRMCWILGKLGGHKTSLAFKVAEDFLKKGYRLFSNTPSPWCDPLNGLTEFIDDAGHVKGIVILDEGGTQLSMNKQVQMILSYPRKQDLILLIPSYWPPPRAAQTLRCQTLFGFYSIGLPLVMYQWRVDLGGFKDSGTFAWFYPAEVYGLYSSNDPGDSATKIVNKLLESSKKFKELWGYTGEDGISAVDEGLPEAELIADAAASMAETADTMAAISIRKRGKRGRF